jgi:arylsulfatase A-like enzyme
MEKPNILLIITDQQRHDSLGCYGFGGVETPNLDKLAMEGVLFENCYVNNPICTPSRASLFTGKQLPGHGVYRLNDILPEDEIMFTKRLRDTGYQTALIGKLHVSAAKYEAENRNKNDGFDIYDWCHEPALFVDGKYNSYGKWLKERYPEFYEKLKRGGRKVKNIPSDVHATKWTADRTAELIKKRDKDKPFCFVMSIFDPHNPYTDYPIEMEEKLNLDKIKAPEYEPGESHKKPEGILREHEGSYMGSFHDYSKQEIMDMRKGYYSSVAFIDKGIAHVLGILEEEGLKDSTIVIFVSDHGDMLGDHELLAKGAFFYDACTKVPMIIRYPQKIKPGQRYKGLVQPHDLAATVLVQAGFSEDILSNEIPDSMDLIQTIGNREKVGRDEAICLYRDTGICNTKEYFDPPINATMLRTKRYKLNVYHDFGNNNGGKPQGELYDMQIDPREKNNLWDKREYLDIKVALLLKMTDRLTELDSRQNGSRGGSGETIGISMLGR